MTLNRSADSDFSYISRNTLKSPLLLPSSARDLKLTLPNGLEVLGVWRVRLPLGCGGKLLPVQIK